MPQIKKRQRTIRLSSKAIIRKTLFKPKKSCIENLSNEIFYEIFDYLDGRDIYESFSNLNIRFQNLLTSPFFRLKIKFSTESESVLEYHYKQFICPNKHQIISLHFHDELLINNFFNLCTLDSLFTCLESIVLHDISPFKLAVLIFYFQSLSRLFSLTIFFNECYDNIGDIYQIIFHLKSLKYLKLEISDYQICNLIIPFATEEQYSSIECLSIWHYCTMEQLIRLLSYTPRLTHLYLYSLMQSEEVVESKFSISLMNLVHLTISVHSLTFDEFQKFLLQICSQLRLLSLTTQNTDINYLDADQWERLIVQHIPYLTRFIFSYTEHINDKFRITPNHALINRWISSFWSSHQWIFRVLIEDDNIDYLIRPYTEKLYIFQEHNHFDTNSNQNISINYYSDIQIVITKILHNKKKQLFINKISPLFEMIQVTRLDIECSSINSNTFIQILNLLPNLDLLRISLISSSEKFFASGQNGKNLRRFLDKNKITKLTLRNLFELEYIYFIIDLFPKVKCLALQRTGNVDLELIVECTLRKIQMNEIYHPMMLCIIVTGGTNDKVKRLRNLIDSKYLLNDYTIYRQAERFYIQWR